MKTSKFTTSQLLDEKQFVHKMYEEKINRAWQVLILALAVPVSAGSLQVPNIEFINARLIMLGACLIGNNIFAYAIWIYREVYGYQQYLKNLEEQINKNTGASILAWETTHNPYRQNEVPVAIIFSTLTLCMMVSSLLSVLYATGAIGEEVSQRALRWYITLPFGIAYVALLGSSLAIIKGLAPSLSK
jgi:hypothetical protein